MAFLTACLTACLCARAQQDEPQYVRVSVETRGNKGLEGIGDFEVFYAGRSVDTSSDGFYLCQKYGSYYTIAPRRADARTGGYYEVYSRDRVSRQLGERIYFEAGADERDLSFPIEIIPDKYAPDRPIEITVRFTFDR